MNNGVPLENVSLLIYNVIVAGVVCVCFSDKATILNEKSLNCCTVDYPYYGTPVFMKSCSTEAEAPIVLCESNDTYTGMLPSNDSIFLEK